MKPTSAGRTEAAHAPRDPWPERAWIGPRPPATTLSSPSAPAPVRQVALAISQWVGRLGAVWVEGQMTQINRRPGVGTVFMTMRDSAADISVPVTCARTLFDSLNPPLVEGASVVIHAKPDYYANRPKKCMNGWGTTFLNITADGLALPCHEARMLPGLTFPNVRDHDMRWIWEKSPGFNAYRGDAWMKEPCRTCPEKEKDFGGCRCQAFILTGDATNADPVCDLSPHHGLVTEVVANAQKPAPPANVKPIVFRDDRNSRKLSGKGEAPAPADTTV